MWTSTLLKSIQKFTYMWHWLLDLDIIVAKTVITTCEYNPNSCRLVVMSCVVKNYYKSMQTHPKMAHRNTTAGAVGMVEYHIHMCV